MSEILTHSQNEKIKAVAMLSGGLDSSLAVKVVADQGIEVIGINYNTGFCLTDHRRKMMSMGADIDPRAVRNEALRAGAQWRMPVEIFDISKEYMKILTEPKHGYGANVNPCIDCRIFMFSKTREYMKKIGAKFIVSGEVLGQRPMSQMRKALELIERESGCEKLILRPLSAKHLWPTIAEEEGWVDRKKLYDFQGRNRKPQMELAKEIGLLDYPQPAGGCCFLTDPNYAKRMKDLFAYQDKKTLTTDQVLLLKVGRHFRISENAKLIVGRNEVENLYLEKNTNGSIKLNCPEIPGPVSILEGNPSDMEIETAARITARYSDCKADERVKIGLINLDGDCRELLVAPLADSASSGMRI